MASRTARDSVGYAECGGLEDQERDTEPEAHLSTLADWISPDSDSGTASLRLGFEQVG